MLPAGICLLVFDSLFHSECSVQYHNDCSELFMQFLLIYFLLYSYFLNLSKPACFVSFLLFCHAGMCTTVHIFIEA